MTREDAIKELKELEYYNRPFDNSEEAADVATRKAQAVQMAIQALEQEHLFKDMKSKFIRRIKELDERIDELEKETQECEDAISRQEAIGIIQNWLNFDAGYSIGEKNVMKCVINELRDLPPVSTEKTGRWIESNGVGMFVCSVCNDSFYPMPTCMGKPLMKYCPSCGCRMMEVEE